MFYKDLYQQILNIIFCMKGEGFRFNRNNCVNVYLSKLYLYKDVAFYGSQVGYLTNEQYSKLIIFLTTNIDTCRLKIMELYEV